MHKISPLGSIVYGVIVCIGVAIAYFELRQPYPMIVEVGLPIAYVLGIVFMVRRGLFLPPGSTAQYRLRGRIHVSDVAKSLVCLALAILWAGLAASLTSNNASGNAITGVPAMVILGIGAFFLARGLSRRNR